MIKINTLVIKNAHIVSPSDGLDEVADVLVKDGKITKIALKKNITSKVDRSAEEKVKVGDIGVTTTRLALIGYAEINGDIVEVKSSDGFLNEKTPIIVDRIADGVLLVERLKQ